MQLKRKKINDLRNTGIKGNLRVKTITISVIHPIKLSGTVDRCRSILGNDKIDLLNVHLLSSLLNVSH